MTGDRRCFVQLPHPGWEHKHDGGKSWHRLDYRHRRKFMRLHGQWRDEDGGTHTGTLHAWGEWEAESRLICERDERPAGSPARLWEPYYVPKSNYHRLHNTDPFIFGPRFLYSNCLQKNRGQGRGLRHLANGSVIAFGSGIPRRNEWVLDTVLVVKDSTPYDAATARSALEGLVSSAFLDVTAGPLQDNGKGDRFRLYRGATPDCPVDGMFSFFPAQPAGGGWGFPRPPINGALPDLKPGKVQGFKAISCQPDELRHRWRRIVEEVLGAGLVLGTRAEVPDCVGATN